MDHARRSSPLVALIGAVTVALASCSGGSSVHQDGTPVQNADELIQEADTIFAELVADDVDAGTSTISEDSRCFFLRVDDADNVDQNVYCGPVRTLVGNDDESWYGLPTDGVEQPEEGLILSLPPTDHVELTAVGTDQLFRPDGAEPIDVSAVEEPQAPEAPVSDFAALVEAADYQIPADFTDLDEPYRLVTPSATLTVIAAATLDAVPAQLVSLAGSGTGDDSSGGDISGDGSGDDETTTVPFYRPADGQQVRAWRVTVGSPPQIGPEIDRGFFSGNDESGRDASTAYAVGMGSQRLSIAGALTEEEGSATIPCEEVQCAERDQVQYLLVASGAADAAPTLIATVDGTDQTLNLDSGELTSDVSQVSYTRDESFQQVSTTWGSRTIHLADEDEACAYYCEAVDYIYGGAVQRVYLSPFVARKGWAPSGRAWLLVPITDDPTELSGTGSDPTIDLSSTWTLDVGGDTISHDPDAMVGHTAAFLVDESFTEGTFVYSPTGSANLGPDDRAYTIETDEPLTLDISFP